MDLNTKLVFETIGLIKKSLQCSICLDLLNDPHSTRCNHQFCSRCIRQVVDERKDKKKEALCPLCKNPITKRSLTSNPRLTEIVDVVRRLNNAFQEDAGLPDSPYPVVNSRLNGESKSYLQFALLNPTPLKPAKFNSRKLSGGITEEQSDSRVNHHSYKYGLRSRGQPGHEKPTSPQRDVCHQRGSTHGMEILSLLESEEGDEPEIHTKEIGEDVNENDETLQGNDCGNVDPLVTRRTTQSNEPQTAKSQEIVSTSNTKTSGSSTIDPGKSSQSSILSNNSVSMLACLLSQQSDNEDDKGIEETDATKQDISYHSFIGNEQNIERSFEEENNDACGPDTCNPTSSLMEKRLSSNDIGMLDDFQKSSSNKHELRRTDTSKSKSSPTSVNVDKSNLFEETSDHYSSERVPASVDSDSQSYRAIPLPLYEKLPSDDDQISLEFPSNVSEYCSNTSIDHSAEKISSQAQLSLSTKKRAKSWDEKTQTGQFKVISPAQSAPSFETKSCKSYDTSVLSLSHGSLRQQKWKRKHSAEETDSCRKYARLTDEGRVSDLPFENDCEASLVEKQFTSHDKDGCKVTSKRLHTKVNDPQVRNVNDDRNYSFPIPNTVTATIDSDDDIIPPTPPLQMDMECVSSKKTNISSLGLANQSKSSRLQKATREEEPLYENELLDPEDDWLKDDACDEDREIIDVSDGGRNPIMDNDHICSSQEDLLFREDDPGDQNNVALLRRFGAGSARLEENATESDDEISDCKTADTTSISSLTDGDAVEVSTQRIKYLHNVLAQTGGEIEKLTADLNNLRKGGANVKQDPCGSDKEKEKMERKIDDINNDSCDKEEVCDSDEENNMRGSDCASNSERENENLETSDDENNINERMDNNNCYEKENEDCEVFDKGDEVRKNSDDDECRSDNDAVEEYNKKLDIKNNDEVEEYAVKDDTDDDSDDELSKNCSLSPPPAVETSALQLTKLPPAIKNLQKLLEQESDSDKEQKSTNYNHCNPLQSNRHHDENTRMLEDEFPKNRSYKVPASKARYYDANQKEKSADVQVTENERRLDGSQKENDSDIKKQLVSGNSATPKPRDRLMPKDGVPSGEVLTELRLDTPRKQRTLPAMLGLNHEARKTPPTVKPSVCFVTTRLPKQFVSLAGYLAKRNGGKVSDDVTEETTHIIMPTDSNMHASRKNYTIKYLLGVAMGKWIVSQLWITSCVKSGRLVDEVQYEVKGDVEAAQSHVPNLARTTRENKSPLLFESIWVVCFGEFGGALSQGQIRQLVRFCGGKVIDFSQELLNFSSTISDLIVICDAVLSEKTELQIKELCKKYSTFPVSAQWVTDSIANYQLQEIEEYRMDIR